MRNRFGIAAIFIRAATCLNTVLLCTAFIEAAALDLTVVDANGSPVPCRVLVRTSPGSSVIPEGAVELKIGPDRWFMSTGRSSILVPSGTVELRVEKGPEYTPFKGTLTVAEPHTAKTVTLKRWIDMDQRGYSSGENHLHVDAEALGPMLAAQDLDFGTMLQWWNGPRLPVPAGNGSMRMLEFGGQSIPTTIHDAEVEHAWGAVYLVGLAEEMSIPSAAGRSNLDFVKEANRSGGIVCYQGGWSREVAVDALLGHIDMINICNNNFHRYRFQPRRRYSNLLEVPGLPLYPNTPEGMMRMNTDTYYRLLNWGLRLAAGAGSATGVKETPVGYNRAYVRSRKNASIGQFYKAWAAGKNFVTNGPMLFLATGDGLKPGDTVAFPAQGGKLLLRLTALSDQPLTSVELVINGRPISFPVRSPVETVVETEVEITEGSWIAARCQSRDDLLTDAELSAYANGKREQPSRLRFAHTSPIYVTVGGRNTAQPESIREGLEMLDHFAIFARRQAATEHRQTILEATVQARRELEKKLP